MDKDNILFVREILREEKIFFLSPKTHDRVRKGNREFSGDLHDLILSKRSRYIDRERERERMYSERKEEPELLDLKEGLDFGAVISV